MIKVSDGDNGRKRCVSKFVVLLLLTAAGGSVLLKSSTYCASSSALINGTINANRRTSQGKITARANTQYQYTQRGTNDTTVETCCGRDESREVTDFHEESHGSKASLASSPFAIRNETGNVRLESKLIHKEGVLVRSSMIARNVTLVQSHTTDSLDPINIVYCMDIQFQDDIPKFQFDTFRDSIQTAIHFSSPSTRNRLHIRVYFMRKESERQMRNLQVYISSRYGVNITVEHVDESVVTTERMVWGYGRNANLNQDHPDMKKLMNPANYLRYYLAEMLPQSAKKFWYFDYDVLVSGDIAELFDQHLNDNRSMAVASNQNMRACSAGKIINMDDPRLRNLTSLRKSSQCICSGIMLLHRQNWIDQERRKRLEWWLAENKRKKLWSLGSLPPLMLEFDGDWEDLPSNTVITDNKGQLNVPNLQIAKRKGAILVHPFKNGLHIDEFRIWMQVCFSPEDIQTSSTLVSHYSSMNLAVHNLIVVLEDPSNDTLNQTKEFLYSLGIVRIAVAVSRKMVNSRFEEVMKIVNAQEHDWIIRVPPTAFYQFPGSDGYKFLERVDHLGYDSVLGAEAESNVTFVSDNLVKPCDKQQTTAFNYSRVVAFKYSTKLRDWCIFPHFLQLRE